MADAGADHLGERAGGPNGGLPAAPAARSTRPCTGRTPRARSTTSGEPTLAPYVGPVPIVTHVHGATTPPTRATATPRPGTCRTPATSRTGTRRGNLPRPLRGTGAGQGPPGPGDHAWAAGHLGLRVPERPAGRDVLVPRPHPRHDPAERLRGPGRLLHHPGRPGRRGAGRQGQAGCPSRARPRPSVIHRDRVPRDPDRHPGPLVQRRRLSVLPRHPGVLRRVRGSVHRAPAATATSRPSGTPSSSATRSWSTGTPGRPWRCEPRRYRFRFLNGCNSRFLILRTTTDTDQERRGLRPTRGDAGPHVLADRRRGRLPARAGRAVRAAHGPRRARRRHRRLRAASTGRTVTLVNVAPDEPFGGGAPGVDFDPGRTRRPPARSCASWSAPRPRGGGSHDRPVPAAVARRSVGSGADGDPTAAAGRGGLEVLEGVGPRAALLGVVTADDAGTITGACAKTWMDPITENPQLGVPEIVGDLQHDRRRPPDPHPRGPVPGGRPPGACSVDDDGMVAQPFAPTGSTGRGRTVGDAVSRTRSIAYPGEVTRLGCSSTSGGLFVWHCHIVDHEDNEMMRPLYVGTPDPSSPVGSDDHRTGHARRRRHLRGRRRHGADVDPPPRDLIPGELSAARPGDRVDVSSLGWSAMDDTPLMPYRRLGRSGLKVSALSFGSWVTFGAQLDTASPRSASPPPTTAG